MCQHFTRPGEKIDTVHILLSSWIFVLGAFKIDPPPDQKRKEIWWEYCLLILLAEYITELPIGFTEVTILWFSRREVRFSTPKTFFGFCQLEFLVPWKKTSHEKIIFDCCPTTSRGVCNPSATTNVESSCPVVLSIRLHFAVELRWTIQRVRSQSLLHREKWIAEVGQGPRK